MKKIALICLGILIGVIGTYLFKPIEGQLKEQPKINEQVQTPDSIEDSVKQTVQRPKGIISKVRAIELSNAYTQRYNIISKHLERNDNRSVWFSIEEMQNFLEYTQYESLNLLQEKYVVNGIRVYLAAYPKNNLDQEKAGYTTVFMVPTFDNTKSRGSMLPLNIAVNAVDIPDSSPLNEGDLGNPPSRPYPN